MLLHTRQLDLTKNLVMRGGKIVIVDGLSSSPSINFENSPGTGIYLVSPSKIGFSTSGQLRFAINTASVTSNLQIRGPATGIGYSFDGDIDTGISRISENTIGFYTGNTSALEIKPDQNVDFKSTGSLVVSRGNTNQRPANPESGMFRLNTDTGNLEYYFSNKWYVVGSDINYSVWSRTAVTTATYTVLHSDHYIGINYGGNVTIYLPDGITNKKYIFKDESGQSSRNKITIIPAQGQTIDGQQSIVISINYASITLVFGATEWHIF
jgi:hypothetical protein